VGLGRDCQISSRQCISGSSVVHLRELHAGKIIASNSSELYHDDLEAGYADERDGPAGAARRRLDHDGRQRRVYDGTLIYKPRFPRWFGLASWAAFMGAQSG